MKISFSSLFVTVYTLIAGLSIGLFAPKAEACSPPPPGVYGSVPETGSQLPSNAAIVFTGQAMMLEDFSVTVDGIFADLIPIAELSVHFYAGFSERLALKVEPEPLVGQQVTILGCVGSMWNSVEENTNCTQFNFVAAPSDQTPPSAPYSAAYDIYDHAPYQPGCCFCQTNSDVAYHLDFAGLEQNTSTQAANFVSVQAYLASDSTESVLFESLIHVNAYEGDFTFRVVEQTLQGQSAENALCFRLTSFDAAMNPAAEVITLCDPCHLKTSTDPIGEYEMPPAEPSWTTSDLVDNGSCISDPCANLECPDNTHCVPRPAGESGPLTVTNDCVEDEEPLCDKECSEGYHCELVTVSCFAPPCPPMDTCIENVVLPDGGTTGDPCADLNCPENTHCVSNGDSDLNIQDHCIVDNDPQCNLECPPGNICELLTVTCVTSPCPPIQICTDLSDGGVDEPVVITDAGTVIDIPQLTTDAGTTETEPQETTDAGTTETEPQDTNEDEQTDLSNTNNSSSSSMNCECGTTTRQRNSFPGLLLSIFSLLLLRKRWREK